RRSPDAPPPRVFGLEHLEMLSAWCRATGLVSSPTIGCAPQSVLAELECAFLNTYQVRWQCFADSVGLGFAQGKAMLWRRDLLDRMARRLPAKWPKMLPQPRRSGNWA